MNPPTPNSSSTTPPGHTFLSLFYSSFNPPSPTPPTRQEPQTTEIGCFLVTGLLILSSLSPCTLRVELNNLQQTKNVHERPRVLFSLGGDYYDPFRVRYFGLLLCLERSFSVKFSGCSGSFDLILFFLVFHCGGVSPGSLGGVYLFNTKSLRFSTLSRFFTDIPVALHYPSIYLIPVTQPPHHLPQDPPTKSNSSTKTFLSFFSSLFFCWGRDRRTAFFRLKCSTFLLAPCGFHFFPGFGFFSSSSMVRVYLLSLTM